MPRIRRPMQIPDLLLHPPITDSLMLSADIQQTLATLVAMAVGKRVPIRATDEGILMITSPHLIDVRHITGSGGNDHPDLPDIPCSEVLIMGHPDNADKLWVRNGIAATTSNAFPLSANQAISVSVHNVNNLSILVVADGETAILAIGR